MTEFHLIVALVCVCLVLLGYVAAMVIIAMKDAQLAVAMSVPAILVFIMLAVFVIPTAVRLSQTVMNQMDAKAALTTETQ